MAECVFCGDHAGSRLRVPYGYLPGVGDRTPGADTLVELPCCMECREILDEVSFVSLEDAARYLASVYREAYVYLLADSKWTREELDELGHTLRSTIEMSHRAHLEVRGRLEKCERAAALVPEVPEDVMGDIAFIVQSRLEAEKAEAKAQAAAGGSDDVMVGGDGGKVGEVLEKDNDGLAGIPAYITAESAEPYTEEPAEASPEDAEMLPAVEEEPPPPVLGVSRKSADGPMAELHDGLAERYASLRATRGGLPVFCLEHGLDPEARVRLVSLVGAEIRRRGIGRWWRDRYLPLLAVASETGYSYLGTGTDFWPRLSSDIGADVAPHEREELSALFAAGHREHGLRRPVPTPWNRAFRHIAWPIANAVAPKEIHRPLASTLRVAFRNPPDDLGEAALVEALTQAARRGWSSRLVEWLADGDLAAAVSLRLLDAPDPLERLSADTLDRILRDLSADREARRDVERAVALREVAKAGVPGGQRVPPLGRCSLRLAAVEGGGLELSLVAPPLPADVRSRLLRAFAAKGHRISPWGAVPGVDPAHFLSGFFVPLPLQELPECGAPFLPGLDALGLEASLAKRLSETAPDLSPPVVFRARDDGGPGIQSRESALARGARYLILTGQGPDRPGKGLRVLGAVAGLDCVEVNTGRPDAVAWLSGRGLKVAGGLSVEVSGGLPLGEGPEGPTFAPGFPILMAPKADGASPWPVMVRRRGEDGVAVLDAERPFAVVDAIPGKHVLLLESALGKEEVILTVEGESQPACLVTVEAEPSCPTMDDLINGAAVFKVASPLPAEGVGAVATLTVAGTEVARSADVLSRLPAVIGPASDLLRGLAERSRWQSLPRDAAVELSLDVGGVWRGRWRLGWALRECSWESHGGRHEPLNDDGPLPILSVPAGSPLSTPACGDADEGFRLLLAEVDGEPAWDSGLCIGPRSATFGQPRPELRGRLLRRAESDVEGLGLIPCLQAYAAWASAASAHLLADLRRRSVAAAVEAAAVEQLCGRQWAETETRMRMLSGDRWDALTSLAVSRSLAMGTEFPDVDPADHRLFLSFLQSQLRVAVPDLWEQDAADLDADAVGQSFDEAVNRAYDDLAAEQVAQGRLPCDEADAGKDPAEWLEAVRDAVALQEMRPLVRMILPARRAAALVAPDYSALSSQDVVALLDEAHVDVQGRPRWLSAVDLGIAFALWVDPRSAVRSPGWREAAEHLLSDRQTVRAVRYAALRFKAARDCNLADGVNDG